MEQNENTDELTHRLEKSLHELFHLLYEKNKDPKCRTQGKILKVLYVKGPMSQKRMQEKLNIQPGSISEIINKLEKKELVRRQPDETDRRRIILSLTEKGREDVEEFSRNRQNQTATLFQVLDEADKRELDRILQLLLNRKEKRG